MDNWDKGFLVFVFVFALLLTYVWFNFPEQRDSEVVDSDYNPNMGLYKRLNKINPEQANHCADLDLNGESSETVKSCFLDYLKGGDKNGK